MKTFRRIITQYLYSPFDQVWFCTQLAYFYQQCSDDSTSTQHRTHLWWLSPARTAGQSLHFLSMLQIWSVQTWHSHAVIQGVDLSSETGPHNPLLQSQMVEDPFSSPAAPSSPQHPSGWVADAGFSQPRVESAVLVGWSSIVQKLLCVQKFWGTLLPIASPTSAVTVTLGPNGNSRVMCPIVAVIFALRICHLWHCLIWVRLSYTLLETAVSVVKELKEKESRWDGGHWLYFTPSSTKGEPAMLPRQWPSKGAVRSANPKPGWKQQHEVCANTGDLFRSYRPVQALG